MRKCLVLDAMGVIYKAGDDVGELLIPFIQARGSQVTPQAIEEAYMRASLGQISSEEFWREVNLPADIEDEYLQRHQLSPGLLDFLEGAMSRYDAIMCLSNDVWEWSQKLRSRFGLEKYISRWYISGELGIRKPSVEIYQAMVRSCNCNPNVLVLVDDRVKNLLPAREMGMETVLFDLVSNAASSDFSPRLRNFQELEAALLAD